jgi:hypothetical protein
LYFGLPLVFVNVASKRLKLAGSAHPAPHLLSFRTSPLRNAKCRTMIEP